MIRISGSLRSEEWMHRRGWWWSLKEMVEGTRGGGDAMNWDQLS